MGTLKNCHASSVETSRVEFQQWAEFSRDIPDNPLSFTTTSAVRLSDDLHNSAEGKRPRKRSWRCQGGESAVIPQFGGMFPRTKIPACFVVAVSVRAGDPSTASQRRNHRSEKIVVFSERAGLLDSVRFFRTDLGENQMVQLQASQAKQDLSAQSKSRNIYK